jgi:chromosome partitioning protein
MEADSFSIMGLYQMAATINDVRSHRNPELDVMGIVLTKHKPRQRLASDLREAIEGQAERMGTKVLHTYIREGVAVKQAQAMKQSIFEYAPKSNPARDYAALYEELGL